MSDITDAEANGNTYLIGAFIASLGAWCIWSFGIGLMTLGGLLMVIALVAGFFPSKKKEKK